MAHDVGAENQAGVVVDDDLGDAGGVLHRPAVGHVAEVLDLDLDVEPLCPSLVLGQADAGDLRVGEHRRRHVPMVGRHERVGVVPVLQEVVLHDARLVVGHVLELIVRRHVAERENAARRWCAGTRRPPPGRPRSPSRRPVRRRAGHRWASCRWRPAARRRAPSNRPGNAISTPSPSCRASATSWWSRISHFLEAMSVKRSQIVVVVAAQQRAAPDHHA